jgi:flagellar biosynthesis protein FlhG
MNQSSRNIIAIGGGKGGIGKSVVSTNLAVGLALAGHSVILADTDYGASNLHALLGIRTPAYGFHDLISLREANAESLLIRTAIANLRFLSGAGDITGSANIGSDHVKKIASLITPLNADTIILDLGPGTSYNVIDFFNIATRGVALTIPETTSVMNTFGFLRAALFHKIAGLFHDRPDLISLVDHSRNPETGGDIFSVTQLKTKLKSQAPKYLPMVDDVLNSFRPGLIINRVRKRKDLLLGENLIQLVKKHLSVRLELLGYVVESDHVRESVNEMVPFLVKDPQSKPSENIQKIISTLTQTNLRLEKKDGVIHVSKQVSFSAGWKT